MYESLIVDVGWSLRTVATGLFIVLFCIGLARIVEATQKVSKQ